MKIAIDIGGVISKYPDQFRAMILSFWASGHELFIISDMHPAESIRATLTQNNFGKLIPSDNVLSADYVSFGDACKAVLLRHHKIDVFVDDHPGYLFWPWPTPAPLRLRVEPDPRQPYWHPGWKCDGGDFGRRVFHEDERGLA